MMVQKVLNWIGGRESPSDNGATFEKISPHDGSVLFQVAQSNKADVDAAVAEAKLAQKSWAATPPVQRGHLLHMICNALEAQTTEIADIVARETGKSPAEATGEVGGAVALGRFFAGEGQRLYGRTTTSGAPDKYSMTIRQPCGVAGLIIAANTPIANTAWKVFPALICGNGVVLKAAEDTPATSWIFSKIAHEAGLPAGIFNVIQGYGLECGAPLVEHEDVDVISFTGSSATGRWIGETCGGKLKKVSLELGGKNPLVVCDDADLDLAVKWICLSAFSNAGQRCAANSRVIVFESVYDELRDKLMAAAKNLKVGPNDGDDFGPVINERQVTNMLQSIEKGRQQGAMVLTGGNRLGGAQFEKGCYLAPTVIENAASNSEISCTELFGPIALLYKAKDFEAALAMANESPYGLTACIHTRDFDRAYEFTQKVHAGVAVVNAGTYGSEPHMPFGGTGLSGNGSREPGTEALDVYSELKDVYFQVHPDRL